MNTEIKEFVTEKCLEVEEKLTGLLKERVDELARMIATTVENLATKEALRSLQEQVEDLKRS